MYPPHFFSISWQLKQGYLPLVWTLTMLILRTPPSAWATACGGGHCNAARPRQHGPRWSAPPNILFIHVGDMGIQLPMYGDTTQEIPNLSAQDGMVFDTAHVVAAGCSPPKTRPKAALLYWRARVIKDAQRTRFWTRGSGTTLTNATRRIRSCTR